MTKVSVDDINIYANVKRTQWLTSHTSLDYLLDHGCGVEDFFEQMDEWEPEDWEDEDFKYEVVVDGVVSTSQHNSSVERLTAKIDKLQKQVEELLKKDKGDEEVEEPRL